MRTSTLGILLLVVGASSASGQPPTPDERQATLIWLRNLEQQSGGFAVAEGPDAQATISATWAATKALRPLGGSVKDKDECVAFVNACIDQKSGGYRPMPGAKPDVTSTALAILASVELSKGAPFNSFNYMLGNCKSPEDYFHAGPAAAALGMTSSKDVVTRIENAQNGDGTWGKRGDIVRDTATAVIAIHWHGGQLQAKQKESVIVAIKAGQRPDGGWGKEGEKFSDLETTHRTVWALVLLGQKLDIAACRTFVSRCRNKNGSYGFQPGQPGNVMATYYAGELVQRIAQIKQP